MGQIMLDIEDNENSGYFPVQVYETQSEPTSAKMITVPDIPGSNRPFEVVGWCSDNGGEPCEVTAVLVGDSGSGQALMIYGGDYGIRLRPASSNTPWSLSSPDQQGEPFMLLNAAVKVEFSD
ncbi:MAG: hypothetical protein O3B95_04440 [Chloroflexi bacterium]|nr:hypothetical protein [Chloroflexota bacterium]